MVKSPQKSKIVQEETKQQETETFYCDWCAEPFEHPIGPGPKPKFCKPAHRQRAYEAKKFASGDIPMDGFQDDSGAEVARLRKEIEDVAAYLDKLSQRLRQMITKPAPKRR